MISSRVAAFAAWASLATVCLVLALFLFVGERSWPVLLLLFAPRVLFLLPVPLISLALVFTGRARLLWTQVLCTALVVGPLMGFRFSRQHGFPGPSVRLLSYNVWAGQRGAVGLRAEVLAAHPDIVLFQASDPTADSVFDDPAFRGFRVRREGPYTIATRFPLRKVQVASEAPSAVGPAFVRFTVETPIGLLDLYSVHPESLRGTMRSLPPVRQRYALLVPGATHAIQSNAAQRERQIEAIARAAARSQNPVVIAGDTNLPGLSRLFERYLGAYQDGFVEAGRGFGYTFPADQLFPWMRLDRILAGSGLRFAAFGVGGCGASDHRPVWADLQRAP